jgi:hypothetical protein
MQNRIYSMDNSKAIKAQGFGWLNAIHYMAPADLAGVGNLCPAVLRSGGAPVRPCSGLAALRSGRAPVWRRSGPAVLRSGRAPVWRRSGPAVLRSGGAPGPPLPPPAGIIPSQNPVFP